MPCCVIQGVVEFLGHLENIAVDGAVVLGALSFECQTEAVQSPDERVIPNLRVKVPKCVFFGQLSPVCYCLRK